MTEQAQVKTQLFLLEDGTRFEWQGELYKLLSCNEHYQATALDKNDREINFNACAIATAHKK